MEGTIAPWRTLFGFASLALLLGADPVRGEAQVEDPRIVIDRRVPDYRQLNAIGVIKSNHRPYNGTAFLVSRCHVATAGHTAFDRSDEAKAGKRVTFSVGQSDTDDFAYRDLGGQVVLWGAGWWTDTGLRGLTWSGDWALIRLDRPAPPELGFFPVSPEALGFFDGSRAILAGFPGSKYKQFRLKHLWGDVACHISRTDPDFATVYHTCYQASGQSGAPVLALKDGKWRAVGIVSGSDTDVVIGQIPEGRSERNFAVSLDTYSDHIEEDDLAGIMISNYVAQDKCD